MRITFSYYYTKNADVSNTVINGVFSMTNRCSGCYFGMVAKDGLCTVCLGSEMLKKNWIL